MKNLKDAILGEKINKTRIVPMVTKITIVFMIFILVSNFTTNYINLTLNRTILVKLMKQLLTKDLKDLYSFCNNQYDIYEFNNDLDGSVKAMEQKNIAEFKRNKSVALGVGMQGELLFQGYKLSRQEYFSDQKILIQMKENHGTDTTEGMINFTFAGDNYLGMYKFNPKWNVFLIRGEELTEFYQESSNVFKLVSIIIIIISLACTLCGIYFLSQILRFVSVITAAILTMTRTQKMELINLTGAVNDDVTFLGVAFNSLSSTINNLVNIFRKFANQDIAVKAYRDREVRLEGTQRELTCLFTDIKGFTYMTEVLGTDIITLINMHYDASIKEIFKYDGVIGSIIGDALLVVFGALEDSKLNKSLSAILSGYKTHETARNLRMMMNEKKEKIIAARGSLTEAEERVYKAVMIEVGVGIDGGLVFYGNIGSHDRMTNTVIGDNVNSSSRLEALTRVYKTPIICSEYIKQDVENNVPDHGIVFAPLDIVQVKGKTIGKKVFWPILASTIDADMQTDLDSFSIGLNLYIEGNWKKARPYFMACKLPMAEVFKERTAGACPKDWNGIWTMTTK